MGRATRPFGAELAVRLLRSGWKTSRAPRRHNRSTTSATTRRECSTASLLRASARPTIIATRRSKASATCIALCARPPLAPPAVRRRRRDRRAAGVTDHYERCRRASAGAAPRCSRDRRRTCNARGRNMPGATPADDGRRPPRPPRPPHRPRPPRIAGCAHAHAPSACARSYPAPRRRRRTEHAHDPAFPSVLPTATRRSAKSTSSAYSCRRSC